MHASHKAFTLIELLVVIAIIAILAIVVVLTLNPAALLQQSRDANRLSDMATLNSALNLYSTDQAGSASFSMGQASTTYISIPDPSATSTLGDQCQGLSLPPLSNGYVYHCAASSTYRNVNGSGWLPVNFNAITSGAPFSNLPTDPLNASSSGLFYTYTTDGTRFEVTTLFESQKYKSQYASNPPIMGYPEVDAEGSNLSLSELYSPTGLVGYWPLDEGTGSTAQDMSGIGNVGAWFGTPAGVNSTYYATAKVGAWSGNFDGTSDYVQVPYSSSLQPTSQISFGAWFNTNSLSSRSIISTTQSGGYAMYFNNAVNACASNQFCVQIKVGSGYIYAGASTANFAINTWYHAFATYDGNILSLYINGIPVASTTQSGSLTYAVSNDLCIGAEPDISLCNDATYFHGFIDDVRVYNRALSAAEVQALYNAER